MGCIIWLVVTFGGAAWLGTHIARAFGVVWFILCVVGVGWFWGAVLRYMLHLLACGHVAVLTELITHGEVGNGSEPMLAYGRRVVTERFGQVNALFAMNMLVRGILQAFHRTLDWIGELLPHPRPGEPGQPGQHRAACGHALPGQGDPVLQPGAQRRRSVAGRARRHCLLLPERQADPEDAVWIVILERVLTFLLWLVLLAPAALITLLLPHSVRERPASSRSSSPLLAGRCAPRSSSLCS